MDVTRSWTYCVEEEEEEQLDIKFENELLQERVAYT